MDKNQFGKALIGFIAVALLIILAVIVFRTDGRTDEAVTAGELSAADFTRETDDLLGPLALDSSARDRYYSMASDTVALYKAAEAVDARPLPDDIANSAPEECHDAIDGLASIAQTDAGTVDPSAAESSTAILRDCVRATREAASELKQREEDLGRRDNDLVKEIAATDDPALKDSLRQERLSLSEEKRQNTEEQDSTEKNLRDLERWAGTAGAVLLASPEPYSQALGVALVSIAFVTRAIRELLFGGNGDGNGNGDSGDGNPGDPQSRTSLEGEISSEAEAATRAFQGKGTRVIPTGKSFGNYLILDKGDELQVFDTESYTVVETIAVNSIEDYDAAGRIRSVEELFRTSAGSYIVGVVLDGGRQMHFIESGGQWRMLPNAIPTDG